MSKCKTNNCFVEVSGDRLYCPSHNNERIQELRGNPTCGRFKGAIFVKRPDFAKVQIPAPKNDKYYQYNQDYSEDEQTN